MNNGLPAEPPKSTLREKRVVPVSILFFLSFLLFANTFGSEWTYDDFPVIVENPDVRSWGEFLRDSYPGRPLRELTFLLDHALFGLNPAGWHIQSIFWHGLNAGLLFLTALRLGVGRGAAWIAALLFMVHPIQVEVVANLSHRKDSLCLAFSLLSLLAYSEVFKPHRRKWTWLMAATGFAATALLAKENAIVLPFLWGAWELAFLPPDRRILARRRSLAFLFPCIMGGGLWYFLGGGNSAHLRKMASVLAMKANYFGAPDFETYYLVVFKSWAFMASRLLLPVNLAVEYTYSVPASWMDIWVLSALVLVGVVGTGLFFFPTRCPCLFFGLAWGALFFFPVSNLWPLSYFAADRYLYAPSVGLFLALAALIDGPTKGRRFLAPLVTLAVLILALLSWRQSRVWASEESLWTQAIKVSPTSSFALNNLGNIALMRGDWREAKLLYQKSAAVNQLNPTTHYNLGLIAEQVGQTAAALEHYRRFLALNDPMFHVQADQLRGRLMQQHGVPID